MFCEDNRMDVVKEVFAKGMAGAHKEHGIHVGQREEPLQLVGSHAGLFSQPNRVVAAIRQLLAQKEACVKVGKGVVFGLYLCHTVVYQGNNAWFASGHSLPLLGCKIIAFLQYIQRFLQ